MKISRFCRSRSLLLVVSPFLISSASADIESYDEDSVNPTSSAAAAAASSAVSAKKELIRNHIDKLYGSSDVDDEDTVAPVAAKKVDTASLTPAERALLRTITRSRAVYPGIGYGGLGYGGLGYGDATDRPVFSAPVAAKKVDTASLTPAERALLRTITRSRTIYPGIGYGGLGLGTLGYGGIFDEDAIDRPVSSSDEAQAQSSDQTESTEGDSVTDSVHKQPQSKSIVLRLPKRLLFQLIRQFGQRVDHSTHGRSALWNRYALRGRLPWAGRRRFWAAAPLSLFA
ncbi:hypothetical protein BV898_06840 [Hypsibius exemplaris]|uniref:Uncharacterized protein n=1 Tax=Hypsibius exemplaris TaxID=2072580 RepID=A0A1W0WVI9_HYPEX|nr:hypothetical protein BV898_06840 [Hypsibius exemplaris]